VLLAGVLVLSLGAGLGLRHLQKVGLSVQTVAGLTLLACGLALCALGGRQLWRSRRWLLLPTALAGLVVLWSGVNAAVADVVPAIPLGSDTPAAHGLVATEVAVPDRAGVRLSAWWVPPRNGAAVVLLHGAGETRTATLPQATVLARHGYGVLLLDARGHGRSAGRGMDFGWYGDADVGAAVDYLAGLGIARIGLLGLSMGGEEAIGAAAVDPRVAAVVAEGATHRTAADKAAWLPHGPAGAAQRVIDRVSYAFVDLLTPASPPRPLTRAVRESRVPFLLIAAGTLPDEARAAGVLRRQAPERVQVWQAEGASHTRALQQAPQTWEQTVIGFLDQRLRQPL
jgi:pimeloyl-ACP methyl ester carboxylesterase